MVAISPGEREWRYLTTPVKPAERACWQPASPSVMAQSRTLIATTSLTPSGVQEVRQTASDSNGSLADSALVGLSVGGEPGEEGLEGLPDQAGQEIGQKGEPQLDHHLRGRLADLDGPLVAMGDGLVEAAQGGVGGDLAADALKLLGADGLLDDLGHDAHGMGNG